MKGIIRAAAALAATALLAGGLASPARAEGPTDENPVGLGYLNIDQDVFAKAAPVKGCAGIDTGAAVPTADGWLFGRPAGQYTDVSYVIWYFSGEDSDEPTDVYPLLLTSSGVYLLVDGDDNSDPDKLAKALAAKAAPKLKLKASAVEDLFPHTQAPAGVTGTATATGGWIKTPPGWGLATGLAFTTPLMNEDAPFDLVRACPAAAAPSTAPSSTRPSASAGPSLPVTGTNVGLLTGIGITLLAAGAVLFVTIRRRRSVKFVA